MKYELTPLPYPCDALEPCIDAETVKLHHGKHQANYVANLNAALESAPEFDAPESLRELVSNLGSAPEKIRTALRNNGG
ncbi:MAG: superoxide dismutase, partial [Opitutales bacterium]|nr:superoxide dismutase [Opitutales bacterium]